MSRPVRPPIPPHQQTESERFEKTTRRRAKLIREVEEASSQSELAPRDELADKATGKTVDDLLK